MFTQQDLELILILKNKLINGVVVDIKIGYSTMLIISNNNFYYYISIGNSEITIDSKSSSIHVDDIDTKYHLGKVFKCHICSLSVEDDGTLRIEFEENKKKLITKPGMDYEAWEINGPDGFQVVCMPGGNLAFWNRPL